MRSAIALVLMAGTARAQAPGAAPAPTAPPPAPTVMAARWAVGLSLWLGSATARTDGTSAVGLAGLDVAGRFRLVPPIELGLSLALGGGGSSDPVSTGALFADFRYRFLLDLPWNFIALAGVGVATIAAKNGSEVDKRGRPAMRIGGGVERRLGAFGFEADLVFYGIGEHTDVPVVTPPVASNQLAHYAVTGGELSLGASYYF